MENQQQTNYHNHHPDMQKAWKLEQSHFFASETITHKKRVKSPKIVRIPKISVKINTGCSPHSLLFVSLPPPASPSTWWSEHHHHHHHHQPDDLCTITFTTTSIIINLVFWAGTQSEHRTASWPHSQRLGQRSWGKLFFKILIMGPNDCLNAPYVFFWWKEHNA